MGKNVVILGTQWGDEGKGKIVDLLTRDVDAVVRFQGGHNAGHTLVIDGKNGVAPDSLRHSAGQCRLHDRKWRGFVSRSLAQRDAKAGRIRRTGKKSVDYQ